MPDFGHLVPFYNNADNIELYTYIMGVLFQEGFGSGF